MVKILRFPLLYMNQNKQTKQRDIFVQMLSLLSYIILVKTKVIILNNRIIDLEKKLIFTDGSSVIDLVLISFIVSFKFLKILELKRVSVKYFEKKKKISPEMEKLIYFTVLIMGIFLKIINLKKIGLSFELISTVFLQFLIGNGFGLFLFEILEKNILSKNPLVFFFFIELIETCCPLFFLSCDRAFRKAFKLKDYNNFWIYLLEKCFEKIFIF